VTSTIAGLQLYGLTVGRYLDGIIRSEYFSLPLDFPYRPLSTKRDPELDDFFDGFEYRHDIIGRIDHEVRMGMQNLAYGRPVPLALRKLVCYALWGNPVDAYKWFEYSYQNEYMPHRYLPEHVVLGHLPKPTNCEDPRPSVLTGCRRHGMFELVWPVPTTKVLVSAVAATELSCAAPHDAC
jgi:hypothetical protein